MRNVTNEKFIFFYTIITETKRFREQVCRTVSLKNNLKHRFRIKNWECNLNLHTYLQIPIITIYYTTLAFYAKNAAISVLLLILLILLTLLFIKIDKNIVDRCLILTFWIYL